ncbi:MAG: 30S ribosome-binding factor RbfA [Candidatus Omnitrophica bacterium]|nr:30S ribosome-binding factor RbfA [Candidatus Omnitrophota bacterium]
MGVRPDRVASAIRREVSNIIQEEIKDPRVGFTTITKVEITPDLRHAKIYYSVLGDEKQKLSTQIALRNAKGFIRKLIGSRLKLRLTPDIAFKMDKTVEYSDKIDRILEKINRDKKERGE